MHALIERHQQPAMQQQARDPAAGLVDDEVLHCTQGATPAGDGRGPSVGAGPRAPPDHPRLPRGPLNCPFRANERHVAPDEEQVARADATGASEHARCLQAPAEDGSCFEVELEVIEPSDERTLFRRGHLEVLGSLEGLELHLFLHPDQDSCGGVSLPSCRISWHPATVDCTGSRLGHPKPGPKRSAPEVPSCTRLR